MKLFRTVLTYFLSFAVIYLFLLIVSGVVLYQNKPAIEKEVSRLTGNGKVEIGDFFNLPFIMIEARNVRLGLSDGSTARVDRLFLFYNILKMPFSGPAGAVYLLAADKAEWINGKFGDFGLPANMIPSTNSNAVPRPVKTSLHFNIRELTVRSGLASGIHAEADLKNLSVGWKGPKVSVRAAVNLNARISNQVEFFHAFFQTGLDLDLTNATGSGAVLLSNLNLAGVDILENAKIPFSVSNGMVFDYRNSALSNIVSEVSNGSFQIRYEKDFILKYGPLGEFSYLEYVLAAGGYHLTFTGDFKKNGFSAGLTVVTISNERQKWIAASFQATGPDSAWNLRVDTPKYGLADIRLKSGKGDRFPTGTVRLNNLFLMDGMRIGGNVSMESRRDFSRVTADNIHLNGGYLGSAYTILNFSQDGLTMTSPAVGFNNNVEGFVRGGAFEIDVRVNDLPGAAAVSNIFIDFMGIGRCQVSGSLKVVNDGPDQFILTARAEGMKKLSASGLPQKYVSTDLKFGSRDMKLEFPNIYFPQSRLLFNAVFRFFVTDRSAGWIDVNGGINLFHQFDLPLRGSVAYNVYTGVKAGFNIDNSIDVQANVAGETMALAVTGGPYNLKRVGMAGVADLDFRADVTRNVIRDIRVVSRYSYADRKYSLQFKSEFENDKLKVKQFILDNRDDKMIGSGSLWQSGGRLFGQIDFIRGGKISFSSTFDDIIGSLEIRNWFFKDFTKEGQDVFITFKSDLIGPLFLPDMNASMKMVNSVNSEKFVFDAPNIQKKGGEITLKNVSFDNDDSRIDLSGKLESTQEGFILSGDGKFDLYHTFKGKMAFSYFSQTNQNSFSYDLNSLTIGGRDIQSFSGGFILKNSRFTFFKKGENGLSGYYLAKKDYQEWSLDASGRDLLGNYSGEVRNGRTKSELALKAQLYYLGFFDILRDPNGEGRVSLRVQGPTNAPVVNGSLRLYRANIGLANVDTRIRDVSLNLNIENGRVIFNNNAVTTSSGNFILKGYVDLKNVLIPYFDLLFMPADKKLPVFALNYNSPNLKLAGDISVSNLYISGTPSALYLTGNVTADNGLVMLSGLNNPSGDKPLPPLIENIRWNLPIKIGNSVKFSNEFIDVILKKDDMLLLTGSFGNGTFTLKGKAGVDRGTLTYLGRDFIVKDGTANFFGAPGDPYPYVNLSTTMNYRDEKNENVDVYLTFEGKVSTIIVRDFYSVPDKSRSELAAVIGLKVDYASGSTNSQAILASGMNVAENLWFFNPLGSDLRRRLGLDLFTIRTGFLENWARRTIAGDTNVNMASMLEGTSLVVGKYLLPNVFVQYEMSFAMNPLTYMQLVPLHSVGVDFDMRLFDFGWKYQPVSDLSRGIIYENRFELNFNRQF